MKIIGIQGIETELSMLWCDCVLDETRKYILLVVQVEMKIVIHV